MDLSKDLEPPSKDFDVPFACFKTELLPEDLNWKDGDLFGKKPLEVNLDMLSAPPSDWRRAGPLLELLPSDERGAVFGDLKVSSRTLKRS